MILLTVGAAVVILAIKPDLLKRTENTDPADWRIADVSKRDISSSVRATGIIKPMVGAEVRVGSRISGIVRRLFTSIGDSVKKGDLLAELDSTELEARVNQAKAALEKDRADLRFSQLDLERKKELSVENFVSLSELDLAVRTFEVASLQLKEAEAGLQYSQVQLDYTKIYAPISGVVASVSTQEGETVAASFSTPTFVTIIDLNRLEVWAYVDETDIGRISTGQNAFFTVDTYSDTDFEGRVTAIYPKAEIQNNIVNYIAVLKITEEKGKILRPEMTTTVNIFLETKADVLTVPREAVRNEQGRKFVYCMENDNFVKKWVRTGWKDDLYWEIVEGLNENEKVIIGEVNTEI